MEYNPKLSGIHTILNKHKYILELDDQLKTIADPNKIFVSFSKCSNLGDMLVHSRYPYELNSRIENPGCHKCKDNCCACKLYLNECSTVTNLETGRKFPIKCNLTCLDEYVIYLIYDRICNKQ